MRKIILEKKSGCALKNVCESYATLKCDDCYYLLYEEAESDDELLVTLLKDMASESREKAIKIL